MKDILIFFSIFTRQQKKEFIFIFIIMMIGAVLEPVGIGVNIKMAGSIAICSPEPPFIIFREPLSHGDISIDGNSVRIWCDAIKPALPKIYTKD